MQKLKHVCLIINCPYANLWLNSGACRAKLLKAWLALTIGKAVSKPIRCQGIKRWLTLTKLRATGPRMIEAYSLSLYFDWLATREGKMDQGCPLPPSLPPPPPPPTLYTPHKKIPPRAGYRIKVFVTALYIVGTLYISVTGQFFKDFSLYFL